MDEEQDDYVMCLEAAGAVVHCYEVFGSYSGDGWAKVTYQGKTGWVTWGFGSCTGCDPYQANFESYRGDKHATTEDYAAFGRNYLDPIMSQEEAEKEASRNIEWSAEDLEMLKWIQDNPIDGK